MVLSVRAQNNPGNFSRRRRGKGDWLVLYTGLIHRIMEPRSYGPSLVLKLLRHIPLQRLLKRVVPLYPLFAKSGVSNFLQKSSIFPWDFNIWEPHSVQPNIYLFIKFSRYAHFIFWQLCQTAHQKYCTNLYCLFLVAYIEYLSLSTCFEGNHISQRFVYLIYPSKVLVLDLINQFHWLFALWLM